MHYLKDNNKKKRSVCILWDKYKPRKTCFKGQERITRD